MPVFTVLFTMFFNSFNAHAASSEIPAKREFPLNEKISPCENLYEHACTKVIESFQLRADRRRHNFAFSDSAERILEFKKNTIKEIAFKETNDPIEKQLKNFYLSCMDKEGRAKEENLFVQELIARQQKVQTKEEWLKIQAERIHSGQSGFIDYYPSDNFDDPKKSDLMLGVGYSYLPEKSYATKPELIKDLEVLVTDFFKNIGVDHPEVRAKTVLKYEIDQQENRLFPVEARIAYSLRRFVTKKDLIKKYSALQLKIFLDQIPNTTKIRNVNIKTIPFLDKVARTYSLDELKTLEMFYELHGKLDMGYPKYYDEAFAFKNKYLGGMNKRQELQEECTSLVMGRFGSEFDYLVLPKMFPNFSSEKVAILVDKIKSSIVASLEKNTWLSTKAKKEAQKKISTAFMRLVAPKLLLNGSSFQLPIMELILT